MEKPLRLISILSNQLNELITELRKRKFTVYKQINGVWKLIKMSDTLSDFSPSDKWHFEKMSLKGKKSIKVGNTMYSIDGEN